MTTQLQFSYPVPRPQRRDATWYGLFVPIVIYGVGLFLYSFLAFVPMEIDGALIRRIGSGLMVFGGVFGSIASLSEIEGKIADDDADVRDRIEAAVTMSSTIVTLFVTYAKFGDAPSTWWVEWIQANGTGFLLVLSGFDSAVDLSQWGRHVHSFEDRLKQWYEDRKEAETAWQNRIIEMQEQRAIFQVNLLNKKRENERLDEERKARMEALDTGHYRFSQPAQPKPAQRETQRADDTQPMQAQRNARTQAQAREGAQSALKAQIEARDIPERIADTLRVFRTYPDASFATAGEIMGCATSTASRRWSDAVELGLAEDRDGKRVVFGENGGER